jgi:hypothetical protein
MNLHEPITTAEEAKNYIAALHKAGKLYHPEDSAKDIEGLFSLEECILADVRMAECFVVLDDPCEIAFNLVNQED